MQVLYVEDEKPIMKAVSNLLRRRINNLFTAQNGLEGLAMYKQHRPDIVITDIRMPEMDGLEMAKKIKKIEDSVPVIVTTGFNDEKYFLSSIDIGVDKYIKKPINVDELLKALTASAKYILQQKAIDAHNEFIKTILDNTPEFILITNGEGIYFLNKSFLNFMGCKSFDQFKSEKRTLDTFLVAKEESFYNGKLFHEWMEDVLTECGKRDLIVYMAGEHQLKSEATSYLLNVTEIPDFMNESRYIITLTDITHIECQRRLFQDMAEKDPLTNIFNRKKFFDEFYTEIERSTRYDRELSLIIFDIDHFKRVNDEYGHVVGDYVLKEMAVIVTSHIRKTDIFARYGGEEFVILMPEADLKGAMHLAEKIRERIENYRFKHINELTCSFGVSLYRNNESPESMIKRVDDALYNAKKRGRNRVESL